MLNRRFDRLLDNHGAVDPAAVCCGSGELKMALEGSPVLVDALGAKLRRAGALSRTGLLDVRLAELRNGLLQSLNIAVVQHADRAGGVKLGILRSLQNGCARNAGFFR